MTQASTILLVEDNEDDERLTLRAFKRNGIANEVVVAHDGEAALAILHGLEDARHEAAALPQLVLLDLNLPKMSGLDVLRRIRADARTRHLPVVVLTSSREDEDILGSYSLGANAYVRKPVDFAQFSDAVRTLGLFWLVLNEQPLRSQSR